MTDNEIIKALECCIHSCCVGCPCADDDANSCNYDKKYVLDLINRQKAEIEELKDILEKVPTNAYDLQVEASEKLENQIKSEAIKECLARVKNYIKTHCNPYGKPDFDYDTSIKILNFIDNLVKEMTEPSEQNQRRQMKRMIKRFIVWYLKRHNVTFEYNNYVVRMFSKGYYDKLMQSANDMRKEDEGK